MMEFFLTRQQTGSFLTDMSAWTYRILILLFFIFVVGILRKDRQAIALSLLVFFLYGTMIWGVFPHQPGISFESHLWGAGMGVLCAVLFRNRDPAPTIKHYAWESDDEDDPVMSNAWDQLPESKDLEDND